MVKKGGRSQLGRDTSRAEKALMHALNQYESIHQRGSRLAWVAGVRTQVGKVLRQVAQTKDVEEINEDDVNAAIETFLSTQPSLHEQTQGFLKQYVSLWARLYCQRTLSKAPSPSKGRLGGRGRRQSRSLDQVWGVAQSPGLDFLDLIGADDDPRVLTDLGLRDLGMRR